MAKAPKKDQTTANRMTVFFSSFFFTKWEPPYGQANFITEFVLTLFIPHC